VSIVAALGVAGCGAAQTDSADDFEGDQKAVAKVIDDLAKASKGREPDSNKVCTKLITDALAKKIAAVDRETNCDERVEDSLTDVKDAGGIATLEVKKVTIDGDKAVATVEAKTGEDNKTSDYTLARVGNSWRISSF
jgi:hypothetical protein